MAIYKPTTLKTPFAVPSHVEVSHSGLTGSLSDNAQAPGDFRPSEPMHSSNQGMNGMVQFNHGQFGGNQNEEGRYTQQQQWFPGQSSCGGKGSSWRREMEGWGTGSMDNRVQPNAIAIWQHETIWLLLVNYSLERKGNAIPWSVTVEAESRQQ